MAVVEKKKREAAEDFIGWKSPDGKLEVVGIIEKSKHTTFKVTCTECSKDPELFPDGYFVSQKWNLVKEIKPCGCGKNVRWKDWQFLILARRAAKGRFIVHGFAEEFHGKKTKLNLECLKDGYKWITSIDGIINMGSGCPKCAGNIKPTEQEALQKCINICKEMDYDVIGFMNGYKNACSSFEYNCKIHGKQSVRYHNFVNIGTRCMGCWKDKQRDNGNGNGYHPERKDEQDFLYVLNLDNKFIKIGRSFDVNDRIRNIKTPSRSGIKNIIKLRIFTATHHEVYYYEQDLLETLRNMGFQYRVPWTNECFENECLFDLNKILDKCDFEVVL